MKTGTGPERAGSLVIELAARTAIIDGARIELPPTEFDLLAAFASRPGEVVTHKELAALAFGEGASVAPHELHWRIWKVRDVIGDGERRHKLIENRRGVGYVLDLPPSAVQVIEGVAPGPREELVIHLEPEVSEVADSSQDDELAPLLVEPQVETVAGRRPKRLRIQVVLAAAAITVAALGGSWVAGYTLSQMREAESDPGASIPERDGVGEDAGNDQPRKDRRQRRTSRDGTRQRRSAGATGVVSGPVGSSGAVGDSPQDSTNPGSDSSRSNGDGKDEPAPPPPQPNAQLYHLFNSETGDHIMTTSSSVANQKQAEGYSSSNEGGVFTSSEKGTTAISLDSGTAYVYESSGSAPQGVSVAPLYRLSGEDDFFYTSSSSTANQAEAQGWSRTTVGYVAT